MREYKVVSDTHFNHDKIVKFNRQQFKTVDDMNEAIINQWNKDINKTDRVIHLGDFAFGDDYDSIVRIIKRLNGNITLILGNHDTAKKVSDIYVHYFKCSGGMTDGDYYFTHEPLHPNAIDPSQLRTGGRQATINIHGHLHNGEHCSDRHINCCLDVVGLNSMVKTIGG